MSATTIAILALLILLAAMLYSSVGHAGASGYLAAMALIGIEPDVMKPTALCLNVLVACIGTYKFSRAGCFSWPLFWPFAVASVPMAFLGGYVTLPGAYYKPIVGCVLLFAAIRLIIASRRSSRGTDRNPPCMPVALATGAGLAQLPQR